MNRLVTNVIELPKFLDSRGNLSFLENGNQIPFDIKRVHWIYDVPGGMDRGGVAYSKTEEFIIAMSGSFNVIVDDGITRNVIPLNRSYKGVYIPKGAWRAIENFSTNSVALIAASTHYDPQEGIHDYEEFLRSKKIIASDDDSVKQTSLASEQSFQTYNIYDCNIIELDKHHSDARGNISVVENGDTVPFDVKRIYYLYDVPGGESRGGHAHKRLYQLIIAASGSFTVTLDDGKVKRTFVLNRPYQGLLVKPGVWRTLDDFSSGSVCMVLASEKYDESDYIREYTEFIDYRNE